MDYKRSGAPKLGKNAPKHSEHNAYGSDRTPYGGRSGKADLLARMKAAQGGDAMSDDKKKLAEIEGQPLDRPNDGAGKVAVDERGTKNIRGREDLPEDYDKADKK